MGSCTGCSHEIILDVLCAGRFRKTPDMEGRETAKAACKAGKKGSGSCL